MKTEKPEAFCQSFFISTEQHGTTKEVSKVGAPTFCDKVIGQEGGRISLFNVQLDIPFGAVLEVTEFMLTIIANESSKPRLKKHQSLLSPIVMASPSGITFKTKVKLQLPHSAIDVHKDWDILILRRRGNLNDLGDWETMTFDIDEECVISEHAVSFQTRHFTLYTVVGEPRPGSNAAKAVHLVAFTNRLQRETFFKARVYCLNSYKDEIEDIKRIQHELDKDSKTADTNVLIVHNNEMDIVVNVEKLTEGWESVGQQSEILPFEPVWHGLHPHCTFVFRSTNCHVNFVVCDLHSYQSGCDNAFVKLKIADNVPVAMGCSPLSKTDDPTENLKRELVILLDPENTIQSDAGNWKQMAEQIGYILPRVRWLETQPSPARLILDKWFEDGKTLVELQELLLIIHRPDAASEVEKYLPT
ncbi:UN5CL-like protein [Mya arenaria]|uniref:UN5CL-like protein n=2 Tax=Mya arenaria TaxID=6604 RepID=A0ABY7F8U9_MYAAR|nr:UN5CL-like protein [Mya arenaria]